ncbi:MAG: oxidoreductase, partial [Chloroflexi bacterium]|nr:oxidoreductase [Chloroflexota bacterium]
VRTLGMEVIALGKGKNSPLDRAATPDAVADAAQRFGMDPFQVAYWNDGSKTMFEMACAANATGCVPARRGMTGPVATRETVSQVFALAEDGGTVPFPGVVDFAQGPGLAGTVFVTVRVPDPAIRAIVQYLPGWNGEYYTFVRPYHLGAIEAPITIARAVLHRQVTLTPFDRPVADVLTVAKRDLQPGDTLDDFGGYTCYGVIDRAKVAREENALPLGLAPGAQVVRAVKAGALITWNDVALDEGSIVIRLRREQDTDNY